MGWTILRFLTRPFGKERFYRRPELVGWKGWITPFGIGKLTTFIRLNGKYHYSW